MEGTNPKGLDRHDMQEQCACGFLCYDALFKLMYHANFLRALLHKKYPQEANYKAQSEQMLANTSNKAKSPIL